jgi:NADPH-dependent glutamate synthase beta subunit-like oxidoreductase
MESNGHEPGGHVPGMVIPRDEKGRKRPQDMSEREMLIEAVTVLRAVGDALAPMMNPELAKLGPIGLMRALMTGGG